MRIGGGKTVSLDFCHRTDESMFRSQKDYSLSTTTISLLRPPPSFSSSPPWIVTVNGGKLQFCHPLSGKQLLWNLPRNFNLDQFNPSTLAIAHHVSHNNRRFDKLLVVPFLTSDDLRDSTLLALYDGGQLRGCPAHSYGEVESPWVKISRGTVNKFDDILMYKGKICALDREGRVHVINNHTKTKKLNLGKILVNRRITPAVKRFGWRKRLVLHRHELYLVVRMEEKMFFVYRMIKRGKSLEWRKVDNIGDQVLFMARDYCFFTEATKFPGRQFQNCIVFSEAAFPHYGKDCWEFTQFTKHIGFVRKREEDIAVFGLKGNTFAREGENAGFPNINWSPPSWIFRVSATGSLLQLESQIHSERETEDDDGLESDLNSQDEDGEMQLVSNSQDKEEGKMESVSNSKDEKDGDVQSVSYYQDNEDNEEGRVESDSNSGDEKDGEMQSVSEVRMDSDSDSHDQEDGETHCGSNSQDKEDEEMHTDPNIEVIEDGASLQEDISPSSFGPEPETNDTAMTSLSAAEEEVTRTLLNMNGGIDATEETSRKKVPQPVFRPCTSSATKSHEADFAIVKFEGFDIRSNLVPTLRKIWQKHGNITKNSIMRSTDLVARALESLATVVQILEGNSAQSLSDCQAEYLSSTLSDLRCICFEVNWLIPVVEKAIQLHKSKPLMDSLSNLRQLSSQINDRRLILLDELAKLGDEENKLKEEMSKVSKMFPFPDQLDLDEPLFKG